MENDRIRDELASKHRPGSVVKRVGGLKQMASMLTGGGVAGPIRSFVEEAFAAPDYLRASFAANKRGTVGRELSRLSDADWRRSIDTLLPQLAPSANATYELLALRPFQDGISRKPFRCPRSRGTLADIRGRWLLHTTVLLGEYDADIRWVAERAGHLAGWSGGTNIGWLLAGAMHAGGAEGRDVHDILAAIVAGDSSNGQMGRHVTQALMSCDHEAGWELVERLLLSAQRQEGLRQAILESVDEAHPMAFRRMLRLILDENLMRFSSVVRAADTWFGFMWDGTSGVAMEPILQRVLLFLEDPAARAAALGESDAETVYLALWSTAFEDIDAAIAPAAALLASSSTEIRFVAAHFLAQSLWTDALPPLVATLADPDLRVATRALDMFGVDHESAVDGERLFHQLEQLIARVPGRTTTLDALVWPWWKRKLERSTIASALATNVSHVKGERLLPYVPDLSPSQRAAFLRRSAGLAPRWASRTDASQRRKLSDAERAVALDLLGDASAEVRGAAFEAIADLPVKADEVDRLVELLGRKPGDLRTGALTRLRTLGDAALLAAADRLLADESELRRVAGLELLRDAVETGRATDRAKKRAARYAAEHATLTDEERTHVDTVAADAIDTATADDALGLVDRASLTKWPAPRKKEVELDTTGSRESLQSLAELVLEHQQTEIGTATGEVKLLIESVSWSPGPRKREDLMAAEPALPLAPVWRAWLGRRTDAQRDADGLELLRALMTETNEGRVWKTPALVALEGVSQYSAGTRFLRGLLEWCLAWDPPAGVPDFLLDGLETRLAALSPGDYREMAEHRAKHGDVYVNYVHEKEPAYRAKLERADPWMRRLRWWRDLFPASISPSQAGRFYGLLRGHEERAAGIGTVGVDLDAFEGAYRAGVAGAPELLDLLVGPGSAQSRTGLLRDVSTRKPHRALADHPELLALVDRARRRVVEVESQRGDRPSAASMLALQLRWTGGLETLALALPALGKAHFARAFGWGSVPSRQETLSHLVLRSIPRDEDTPDAFAKWARESRLGEARLVELAVYAPQWAAHVNHVLQWPGLEGGVWWIQAHTKDDRSWQLQELKEMWAAEVSERTPLSAEDLTDGAVDVAWFAEVNGQLGAERWKKLDTAAKYAASSGGHTRAQLFARAMGGLVTRDELLARIDESRHQDSVRALGLLPLAEGDAGRRDLLERYVRLEEFRRQARKFGSQRQASEGRAVAIALANLARTAGYRDPQRLQWAMEREAVGELARGPIVLTRDDVTLELSLDEDGVPALRTMKNGKALKALPAALKKDAEVAELKDRLQALKRQRSRVRDALEEAMCRGDRFAPAELRELLAHPVLAPSLGRLVLMGDGVAGYLAEGGRVLRDHAGAMHAIGTDEELRIAHPVELLARGDWSAWQRECFLAERVQPFKQLFREIYPVTATERGTQRSRRYAGHQLNPRQALALLGGRGWVARPEEGVSRTFHDEGVTARLGFQEAFHTPADIEGLTLEELTFTRKGDWTELALDAIPARLFSEAMRDLDLAVSVAHTGGVDPEATASTVEMRAALVRQTCELLGIGNVEVQAHHAIVHGSLADYSIHLGSAGTMVLPGTALPIVAVHSQHRGRLFLPFADDDPRTAEVLSKLLLLARDGEIRDPAVLEWIRAARGGG